MLLHSEFKTTYHIIFDIFYALNITTSGQIARSNYSTDGAVDASTFNAGSINAPCCTVSHDRAANGYVYGYPHLTLKATSTKLTYMWNTSILNLNNTKISLAADVAMKKPKPSIV